MFISDEVSKIFVLKYERGAMHLEGFKTSQEMVEYYFYQLNEKTVNKLINRRAELVEQDNKPEDNSEL